MSVTGSGASIEVDGNKCDKGLDFAIAETSNPTRTLTTTVRTKIVGVPVISVRTNGEIPKDKIPDAMRELNDIVIDKEIDCGDVLIENVAETGVQVIITSSILMQLGAELENKNVLFSKTTGSGGASASAIRAADGSENVLNEQNDGVLDHIGTDAVGGVVGAAGNAVGIQDGDADNKAGNENQDETFDRPKGRSHIKR